MVRGLKFRNEKGEGLYYPCSENKVADQIRGNREADMRLCFRIYKKRLSHDDAHFISHTSIIFISKKRSIEMKNAHCDAKLDVNISRYG